MTAIVSNRCGVRERSNSKSDPLSIGQSTGHRGVGLRPNTLRAAAGGVKFSIIAASGPFSNVNARSAAFALPENGNRPLRAVTSEKRETRKSLLLFEHLIGARQKRLRNVEAKARLAAAVSAQRHFLAAPLEM